MEPIVAYCGLVCTDCPAYVATQANDAAAIERVAAQWREEFGAPDLTAALVWCDGCLGTAGRKMIHCSECHMRACAMGRGMVNCAHCADYPCAELEAFLGFAPEARTRLEGIRAGLQA